ncbi:MAG: Crp/Fnr family transcriptional regulator [Bacteroidota bacterium]
MKLITDTDFAIDCDIQAPCFQHLTPDEMELIRGSKTQVLFRKGENLTKQGAFTSYVLFVTDGLVKQFIEGDGTRNFNFKIIKEGEFIGLSSVFTDKTFQYSSVALSDTRAFLIEKEVLSSLIQTNGMFGFNFMKRFCNHQESFFNTIQSVVYKQMNGRLADVLLYLNDFNTEKNKLFTLLSRKDIADFAGLSTESTVKILKSLEKDCVIKLEEKNILILNQDLLQKISKNG